MLESQTFTRISRVGILIVRSLFILRVQIILIIGSFLKFWWLFIIRFIVGTNMAVDVMQSATIKLNISYSLHRAQTNTAIATEAKRTLKFANGNSVGSSALAWRLNVQRCNPLGASS